MILLPIAVILPLSLGGRSRRCSLLEHELRAFLADEEGVTLALPSLRFFHELLDSLKALHEAHVMVAVHGLGSFHGLLRIFLPEIVLSPGNQALTVDVKSIEQVSTLDLWHTLQSLLDQKDVPLFFL